MDDDATDIEQRLRTGRGLDPVSADEVMRYWLGEELDDAGGDDAGDDDAGSPRRDDAEFDLRGDAESGSDDQPDPDALATEPALREELFERAPIAERAFAAESADWYRLTLSEADLRDLRVVVGPHGEDWRALTDDNRVESIAELVHEADDVEQLDEETPKDLGEVVELADEMGDERPKTDLIVLKEGDDPAYVVDGNHRAVAHVLHLLRGGEFEGQGAYLGVRE